MVQKKIVHRVQLKNLKRCWSNKENKIPRLKVDSTGNVFKDGVNKGVGNTKTKFVNLDSSKEVTEFIKVVKKLVVESKDLLMF